MGAVPAELGEGPDANEPFFPSETKDRTSPRYVPARSSPRVGAMELPEVDDASHAELIRAVGEHLWGSRWQTDMAVALGVNDRTVRRWASGALVPQPSIWAELIRIMRRRRVELGELIEATAAYLDEENEK